MPFDERLAQRIRALLPPTHPVEEKRMFGGIAFMVNGHMCAGVAGAELMLRVGPSAYEECLKLPNAKAMDFTGRPMKGFLFVENTAGMADEELQEWLDRGLRFVATLPAK
ncbi:MAG: TfoX/Sxy family protein [Bryobacterales bacterium]|nr:TfoX/Sxy family protein [Bryobacterales bacterium]